MDTHKQTGEWHNPNSRSNCQAKIEHLGKLVFKNKEKFGHEL